MALSGISSRIVYSHASENTHYECLILATSRIRSRNLAGERAKYGAMSRLIWSY